MALTHTVPRTMRSAVIFGPSELRVIEKPVPEPGPGEVLLRVEAASLCGTDLKIRAGSFFPSQPEPGTFTPGHEYAGTVVAVGPTVVEFVPGDRVVVEAHRGCMRCENCVRGRYTSCLNYGRADLGHRAMGMSVDGGFAEYVVNHVSTLYRLPDAVSFEEAVMITTAGTSMYAIDTMGGLVAGDTVAVIGPGPVGLTAVQLLKAMGAARVILTGTRASRLRLGSELGADVVVDAGETDPVAAVLEATGGLGVDAVLECSGANETVDQAIRMCKPAGRIVLVGYFHGPVTADLNRAVKTGLTLFTIRGEGNRAVGRAVTMAERGLLRTAPLITHRFPLDDIAEAFDTVEQRRDDAVKVVLGIAS
ncbi:zinc-binding dehydrogenase [Nocardia sp. NEAU-G5]|uniref:Zinc-binding dehydrogenase n=1 Tax=Nocardia albiluteola TaxID=2842303 RepID=A0ABS6B207_9NOCA|nr:zinc-binding dehydrogenase [Nocardia albiluteola]MBU3063268.1 zinc-binding dehydrogenase [Nocardia albiluteola]